MRGSNPPEWRPIVGRNPKATAARATALIVIATLLFGVVLLPIRLTGISMEPTYHDGGFTVVNRLAYRFSAPRRGDIVAIRMAGEHAVYLKRIVGLPGERVQIEGGTVYVDGHAIDEPWVVRRAAWELPLFTVGADEFFVVGDNRGMPIALHDLGKTRRERIVGKALF